jgi:outer membrane protein, heavy metal efflux system
VRTRWFAPAPVLLVAACATVPGDAGFDDVRVDVERRTGGRIAWNAGTAQDAEVSKSVDALLAKPLTLAAAVQIALLENRRLQARYAELGIAQAHLAQAGLLGNPVFDAALRFPAGGGKPEIDASVVTHFLKVLFLPLRVRVATAEVEAAKLGVTGDVLELAGRTRAAFVELQADLQLAEMWRQVAESTAASYDAAKALRAAGNTRAMDLDRERAFHDRSLLQLADARSAAADARERLNVLMGLWGEKTGWTLSPRLPDVPKETVELADLESRAVAASVDLARARREIEATALGLGVTDATRFLSDDAKAGASAEREAGEWSVGPTVSLPIPLFDQGQGRIAQAQARLRGRLADYYALAVEVRAAARRAAQTFLSARSKAVFARDEVLPLAGRLVNEAQLQYNAMQIGVFELLQEKARQIQAGRRSVEAQRDYWLARAELQQLLDGKLPRLAAERPAEAADDDPARAETEYP